MEIPNWPASRPLILDDRPRFERLFDTLQPRVSELCFAGLFLFRNAHGYQVSLIDDSLVVLGHGYDGTRYVLPPLGGDTTRSLDRLFSAGLTLYGVDDQFVQQYLQDRAVAISADRDNADYLYQRIDLANLPGNRYHKKRNRIAYFTKRHAYQVQPYSQQHQEGCHNLLKALNRLPAADAVVSASYAAELAATAEALDLAEILGLKGIVILIDNVVRGFALGEQLNRATAVCHFEKSDPFLEGLAQLLNQEFATRLFTHCSHLNREQDLGETGLRQAKTSYHPTELILKYRVTPS